MPNPGRRVPNKPKAEGDITEEVHQCRGGPPRMGTSIFSGLTRK